MVRVGSAAFVISTFTSAWRRELGHSQEPSNLFSVVVGEQSSGKDDVIATPREYAERREASLRRAEEVGAEFARRMGEYQGREQVVRAEAQAWQASRRQAATHHPALVALRMWWAIPVLALTAVVFFLESWWLLAVLVLVGVVAAGRGAARRYNASLEADRIAREQRSKWIRAEIARNEKKTRELAAEHGLWLADDDGWLNVGGVRVNVDDDGTPS